MNFISKFQLCALVLLITNALFNTVNAQLAKEPENVLSPNATAMALYGEIPVSKFTGLPSIQVPIYQVQQGSISIPIVLNYHASGFRPDMHSGWVGVGWNLAAGGSISRSIHGGPDEMDWRGDYRNGTTGNYTRWGFYYNFTDSDINSSNWENKSTQTSLIDRGTNPSYPDYTNSGFRKDLEPDEFTFNFGRYSGKFYWSTVESGGSIGKWKVQCDQPVKVDVLDANNLLLDVPFTGPEGSLFDPVKLIGYPKTFRGFVITAEDGTKYQFGGNTSSIEYNISFFGQFSDYWKATTWNLTKVTAPNGNEVNLTYAISPNEYINNMYISYGVALVLAPKKDFLEGGWIDPTAGCGGFIPLTSGIYSGQLIRPVYLSTISSSKETVSFNSSETTELAYQTNVYQYHYGQHNIPNSPFLPFLSVNNLQYPGCLANLKWRKLNSITVAVNDVMPQNYTVYTHDYSLKYSESSSQRLILSEVKENNTKSNANTIEKLPYKFYYNKKDIFTLPYLNQKIDHWGFYNNISSDLSQFSHSGGNLNDYDRYYAKREANPDSAVYLSGMLVKMAYPTGGVSKFNYEQNSYSQCVKLYRDQGVDVMGNDIPAGGVRVAGIVSYANNSTIPSLSKRYYYIRNFKNANIANRQSSGILGGKFIYYYKDYRVEVENNQYYKEDLFSTQSSLPACINGQGNHIGYSEVTEQLQDGSYTTSLFTNYDTGNGDDVPGANSTLQPARTPYYSYSSREQERGKILQEATYSNNDKLVKNKIITYAAFNKDKEFARAVQAGYFNICRESAVSAYYGISYRFYTYAYLPTQEIETIYDANGGNPVRNEITYTYANVGSDYNSRLVSTISSLDSKGVAHKTEYKYPFNIEYTLSVSPTSTEASALFSMNERNMMFYPVETNKYVGAHLISSTLQTFKKSGINNAYILPARILSLETDLPINISNYKGIQFGLTSSSPLILANNDTRVKAKVAFNAYDDFNNVASTTKEGGVNTSYLWGYNHNVIVAKAANALSNEIFADNFEENLNTWDALDYEGLTRLNNGDFVKTARTGQYGGKLRTTYNGQQVHSFSKKTISITPGTKKYIFSCWVYSNGPAAQVWLCKNRPQDVRLDGSIDYYATVNMPGYFSYVQTTKTGEWIYLQKEVELPADVTKLTLRLTNNAQGNVPGIVWFDNIRLHPSETQMTTYTYSPNIGVTGMSDVNNNSVTYEYDGYNRLILIRDQKENIIKQFQYRDKQ